MDTPRTRAATLTVTLERDGDRRDLTISTRALGEWHLHQTPLGLDGRQEKGYWTVSHCCGLAAVQGVPRRRALQVLYRLAALPACPVPPDAARQMITKAARATPEFRAWFRAVEREVADWKKEYYGG